MKFIRKFALLAFVASLVVLPAVAMAEDGQPAHKDNPPPSVALNAFGKFEVLPIAMGAPWAGQKGNESARERLQANLDERLKPLVQEWNAKAASERTLRIQPEIRHVRFITGGKRFFGGAFAGGSSMLVTLKLTDAATGETIAEPDFYQHANAMGAAWSFGATDKTMLIRISNMVTEYMRANYDNAVGGPVSIAPDVDN